MTTTRTDEWTADGGGEAMTKSERRRARKAAHAAGERLTGELRLPGAPVAEGPAVEWRETARGYAARARWARRYDALNGAPEGDWDR